MSETGVVETLTRNLRPEIRQELLYIHIRSVSHLRQLVHKRENFLNDDHVRRNVALRQNNNMAARRQMAGIDHEEADDELLPVLENDNFINALQGSSYVSLCWNCEEKGHHWQDCLQDRQVFCYGCGAKKVYKPNCPKCKTNAYSIPKNLRTNVPTKEQI